MSTAGAFRRATNSATLKVMPMAPDDAELMLRYQGGDADAFDVLYARHKGPLFRYFVRQNPDRDTAAELFQEVWLRVIRQRDRYQPRAKFSTWLYRVAHSCQVDAWRRRQRRPGDHAGEDDAGLLPDQANPGPEAAAELLCAGERLAGALLTLPDAQREAFLLREEGGLSLEEIAQVTGVGRETAKSRLRYAVSRLRGILCESMETS